MDMSAAVHEHERLFNASVRSGDFTEFVATFAEDAVMSFDGVPYGPFTGRAAIEAAYSKRPPTETMRTTSIEAINSDTAAVRFEWATGGSGSMRVRWRQGLVAELVVAFDQ
jgi:steroid Delta-isomerase